MNNSIVLIEETVSADMDHLLSNIIHDDRAACRRMDVTSCAVPWIHQIRCWDSLSVLDCLRDLLGSPSSLGHLVLPLLRRVILTKLPNGHAARIAHVHTYVMWTKLSFYHAFVGVAFSL